MSARDTLKYIGLLIWRADVVGRASTWFPLALGVLLSLLGLVDLLPYPFDLRSWVYGVVGFVVFLLACLYEVGARALRLEKSLEPAASLGPPTEHSMRASNGEYNLKVIQLTVINESESTITGLSLEEVELTNAVGVTAGTRNRPFRLSRERPLAAVRHGQLAHEFNLKGRGDTEVIEIAELDEGSANEPVRMLYALAENVIPRSPYFPHRIVLRLTGDNIPSIRKTFEIGIKPPGHLYMVAISNP